MEDKQKKSNVTYIVIGILSILIIILMCLMFFILGRNSVKLENEEIKIFEESREKLGELSVGDIVQYSNKDWIVINKSDLEVGLLLRNPEEERIFGVNNLYDLQDEEALGYYLNNFYIETLQNSEAILNHKWEIGEYKAEGNKTIECQIGLLTKKEYIRLNNLKALEDNDLEENLKTWWLLTPSSSNSEVSPDFVCVSTATKTPYESWTLSTRPVRPVVYFPAEYDVINNMIAF